MSRINIKFGDFVNIQPKIDLTKGANYPFIEMADVEPFSKQVNSIRSRVWKSSGGAKFENGDTIFARITPCLEHGKIAKIENLIGGKGFGSTEFYVFRAKDGISDKDYIYYLARSSAIREPAIKSMIGSSGRQRAQKSVIENIQINVPDIETQKRIVGVLANYDDLIENNKRRIALLEESARQLYKEWFVRFRFPGHEHVKIVDGVPEGWDTKPVSKVCSKFVDGDWIETKDQGGEDYRILQISNIGIDRFVETGNRVNLFTN